MNTKHGIFFSYGDQNFLLIKGLLASFFCFFFLLPTLTFKRSMIVDDFSNKFTNWSNVLLKLSQFEGKLFKIKLSYFLFRSPEKAF